MHLPTGPIVGPSAWTPASIGPGDPWRVRLEGAALDELLGAARSVEGVPLDAIDTGTMDLPSLRAEAAAWRRELRDGRGFVLVRGLPVETLHVAVATRAYWILGALLGTAVPQNGAGDLLCDIRDTGADPANPNTRLYATRAEQDFHTDGADIIGLLALRPAKTGGLSRLVSSVSVFNAFRARRPDLVSRLFEPWHFHLHGEFPPGFPAWFEMPICRWEHGRLSTFFIAWYIRRAQVHEEVPRLTPEHLEALALFESIANEPGMALDMDFAPGDIQWLKNAAILHKRTAYEDHEDPAQKRHLLRLWLAAPDFADGDERVRGGMDPAAAQLDLRQSELQDAPRKT